MKGLSAVLFAALLGGCATGEAYRTTVTDTNGVKTIYEAKRTGYWFAGKLTALNAEDQPLEIK